MHVYLQYWKFLVEMIEMHSQIIILKNFKQHFFSYKISHVVLLYFSFIIHSLEAKNSFLDLVNFLLQFL